MASYEQVQAFYERGLKAARAGRFMAADHFFQRAVSRAYELKGLEGRVHCARHVARIYKDQGLARMAGRHYRRALAMLSRAGEQRSGLYAHIVSRLEELNRANLNKALGGVGILSPGNGPVTELERNAPLVLEVVRGLTSEGRPSDEDCRKAACRLNDDEVPTGKGGAWTARQVRDLCDCSGG